MKVERTTSNTHHREVGIVTGVLALFAAPFLGPTVIPAAAFVFAMGCIGAKCQERDEDALINDDDVVREAIRKARASGKKVVEVKTSYQPENDALIPLFPLGSTTRTTKVTLDD